jgi:hypothetical protein
MTGGECCPSAKYYHAFAPCCPCGSQKLAQGGQVRFFWQGPAALSEAEEKEWSEYLSLLDDLDRAFASEVWKVADRAGKQKLLMQVRTMKPAPEANRKTDE